MRLLGGVFLAILIAVADAAGAFAQTYGQVIWGQQQATTTPNIVIFDGSQNVPIGQLNTLAHTFSLPVGSTITNPILVNPTATTPAATDNSANVATTAWYASLKNFRTFQSFGAVGNGAADDTAAVQTALNSNLPISCNGTFNITGLVTIAARSFQIFGGGWHEGQCEFLLNGPSAMFYGSALAGGVFASNQVVLKDIKITPKQAITAAVGPAQTAAFYLTYPAGLSGTVPPTLEVENVRIQGDAAGHYILYGFALNEFQGARFNAYYYEGNRNSIPTNNTDYGIILTGTHAPTTVTVDKSFVDIAGGMVYAPAQTASGWQDIRVTNSDCVGCYIGINVAGASDALSGYLYVEGFEGSFETAAIASTNVFWNLLHHNTAFLQNGENPATPACYNITWTLALPANSADSTIDYNVCDGGQLTTYTGNKAGVSVTGTSNANMNTIVGPNVLSSLDIGVLTAANTSGVTIYKQAVKAVTAEWSNGAAAGNITPVPPLARVDGSTAAAGQVGEVVASNIASGSAVVLVATTAKDITTVSLTPGHWTCYGDIAFNPNAATTITLLAGGANAAANALPTQGTFGAFFQAAAFTAGTGGTFPVGTFTVNPTTTTVYHLVALSSFAVNSMSAYGNLECQRTQ
jgi:hypothetical protein